MASMEVFSARMPMSVEPSSTTTISASMRDSSIWRTSSSTRMTQSWLYVGIRTLSIAWGFYLANLGTIRILVGKRDLIIAKGFGKVGGRMGGDGLPCVGFGKDVRRRGRTSLHYALRR